MDLNGRLWGWYASSFTSTANVLFCVLVLYTKGSERVPKILSVAKLETENDDDDKGWTVFQRRKNGNVDFNRNWADYAKGFGNREGDFWLGLERIHQLTKSGNMELKIKMITREGIHRFAKYSDFRIGPGSDKYRLHVSGFSGNALTALGHNNNFQFLTKDADNARNCASMLEGGWWYYVCGSVNLNGNFHKTGLQGIWWYEHSNLLRFSEMMFREKRS